MAKSASKSAASKSSSRSSSKSSSRSSSSKGKSSGGKGKAGSKGGKSSVSKSTGGGGRGSYSASKSGSAKGKSSCGSSRGRSSSSSKNSYTSYSSSTKMSEESKAKLEKSFRNKVERTMQSDWYKVRRQGGSTYEEFVNGKVKELTREYNNRRRTEDRIVDKYQEALRSKPRTKTKIKGSKCNYEVKTDDNGEIYQINTIAKTDMDNLPNKDNIIRRAEHFLKNKSNKTARVIYKNQVYDVETNENGEINQISEVTMHDLPNKKVSVGGYEYETDEFARTTKAGGHLQEKNHDGKWKINVSMDDIGKGDQKETDNRGHLIADTFNGLPDLINLVPQDSILNSEQGEYNKLEKTLKEAVNQGKKVYLQVDLKYDENDASQRPIGFYMTYSIDGEYSETYFKNQESQEE